MKKRNEYRPILVVPAVPTSDGIRFLDSKNQLDLKGDIANKIWKILSLCNGYKNIDEIVLEINMDKVFVQQILIELDKKGIICDSREQYKHFHKISSYPANYFRLLNEEEVIEHKKSKRKPIKKGEVINYSSSSNSLLYDLQINRKSCRNFSKDKKLTISELGNICEYAYSLRRHSTPSGGALFPLKLYCVVAYDQEDFKAGYYEYDSLNHNLVLYNDSPDLEQLKYCYNDETLAFNSPIQIIISADLERQAYKYSNRGYRLSLIEVGQVAQNISLYCEEKGLSTCELGGILDIPLSIELDLIEENIFPILGIAVGYNTESKIFKYSELLSKLNEKYVGDDKPIKRFGVNHLDVKNASFYGAWAVYSESGKRISGATGSSYNEAVSKAIIEGYERYCSCKTRIDYIGSAKKNKMFINPEEIAPLTDEQRKLWNLRAYKEEDEIEWTKDMTGNFYIPTDFVYYGHKKDNKLFYSDSSGIAAYSDYDMAKRKALTELIERDAVMRTWYKWESPMHVNPDILTTHIKNRINHWKKENRNVHILDLNSEYLPTFLVVIVGNEYPCFVSGAASATDNVNDAILKAFQEAEYNLLLAKESPIDKSPMKEKVKTPLEHGQFYHFYENTEKISWLWEGNNYSKNKYDNIRKIDELIKELEVIFVDLSSSKEEFIKVVRAVSKRLIPISFGYKRDYYCHPMLKDIKINSLSREYPHFFA